MITRQILEPYKEGLFVGNQDATIFTATKNFADDIRWVFKAASTDTCRAVLCKTICICHHLEKQWAVATDGRRLHGLKLDVPSVSDGVYHLLMNTPSRVVAIKDIDAIYPNWFQVVPAVAEVHNKVEINCVKPNAQKEQSFLFQLPVAAAKLSGSVFAYNLLLDAASGFKNTMFMRQKDVMSVLLLTKNSETDAFAEDRFAVVMPMRA